MFKTCTKCGMYLECNSENFHKDKCQKDGFTTQCKRCRLESKRKYDLENKEDINKRARQNYENNLDFFQNKSLYYYHENREERLAYNKQWILTHPKERSLHKIKYSHRRRSVIGRGEIISNDIMNQIIDLYPNCPYCGIILHSENRQFDHVYPLSKGGEHCIENLICCCNVCNNKKQNKLPLNWFKKTNLL